MNDTLIFLVLAALALIFKWLTRQASDDSEKPEPPSPNEQAPPRPPAQSEEERIRRFLEALGAPPGTRPPPPVRQRRGSHTGDPTGPEAQNVDAAGRNPCRPWLRRPQISPRRREGPLRSSRSWRHPSSAAPPPQIVAPSAPPPMPRATAPLRAASAPAVRHIAPQPCQRSTGGYPARSAWSAARLASPRRSP